MEFSIAIVGIPNVGKSTLFNALTKKAVDIASYPFTTINPNIGIVQIPDKKLEEISKIIKPKKTTPAIIKFVDIAGLIKGAHKGEGLGNQFLAHIRDCDAILEVVRFFENKNIENILGEINPKKEIEIIRFELLMKDLETLEKTIEKLKKKEDRDSFKKIEILEKIKKYILSTEQEISKINLIEKEKEEIKEYRFLTQKPILFILNIDNKANYTNDYLSINLKEEKEYSELSEKEIKELNIKPRLDKLIINCYNNLDLITFYTITGGEEVRAWAVPQGLTALKAGRIVHSDFENKFIKAEVLNWENLFKLRSWQKAKELGLLKTTGKDYIVQNGDIIEFKI